MQYTNMTSIKKEYTDIACDVSKWSPQPCQTKHSLFSCYYVTSTIFKDNRQPHAASSSFEVGL
jgi:hypothetical protein